MHNPESIWISLSLLFSHSVMSNSLRPHGLQHTRLPCLLLPPRIYSNSCPLSWWCRPTISSSVIPLSSRLQSFPASGKWVSSSHQVAKVLELQHQSFQWIPSTDLLAVQGTLKSLLQHHSSKASVLQGSASFIVQLSHPYMTSGKTIALTRWTFVGEVMSLLFNLLSRMVIACLPRIKCLLISWLQSPSVVILEPPKIKPLIVSIVSPSICHEVMEPDAMILVFCMLSVKPTFSVSFFHFHQEALCFFFAFCHKGGIICISEVIFLLEILITAYTSSSPAFLMMYST